MRIIRLTKESTKALLTHKLRAFFMMAGTLIGVMALTAIMTISVGTARKLKQQISKWPHDVIKVNAGGGKGYTMPRKVSPPFCLPMPKPSKTRLITWYWLLQSQRRGGYRSKAIPDRPVRTYSPSNRTGMR